MNAKEPADVELASAFRSALRQTVFLTRKLDLDADLTAAQLSVLNMVADGGMRVSLIAANMGVRVPSATEQIIRLEAAGLLTRESDPTDSRAVVVRLTSKGSAATEASNRRRNELMAAILGRLETQEQELLRAALPVFAKLNTYFDDSRN